MIHELLKQSEKKFPRIGTIRLGIRKESQNGVEYPETVPHFVLDDAQDVAKAYGNTPTEIEAFFLSDDLDEAIPNFWKWYSGGKRDKNGNVVGGQLLCWGQGPEGYDPDGSALPGKAWHRSMRDPKTGIIPNRPCLGEQCKDYLNDKGKPQCQPVMTLNLYIPRASLAGIFTIETKSKSTMLMFLSQLNHMQKNFGRIKGVPFTIYRKPVQMENPERPGQKRTQYIVSIKPCFDFADKYGKELQGQLDSVFNGSILSFGKKESLEYTPSPDVEPLVEVEASAPRLNPAAQAAAIAQDPEIASLFDQLASLKNTKFDAQTRSMSVRKLENSPDVRQAVIQKLQDEITKLQAAKVPEVVEQRVTQPTVQVDANGLI